MFRQSVTQGFLFGCIVGLPIYFGLVLMEDGLHFDRLGLLVGAVGGSLFGLLLAWIAHRLFPVAVSADGISAHSFWGVPRFIRWEHIEAARPFRMLNLRFVRLYSTADDKVTWVALFPADPEAFRQAVRSAMPPNSPLSAHIQ